jgi:hypothetical protein
MSRYSETVITPETLTNEMIEELRLANLDNENVVEDCDVAMGGRPIGSGYRSTATALIQQAAARQLVCCHINAHRSRSQSLPPVTTVSDPLEHVDSL